KQPDRNAVPDLRDTLCSGSGGLRRGMNVAMMLGGQTMSGQPGWRWCRKCEGLFFAGNPSQGVCAADIGRHDPSESGSYVVDLGDSALPGQNQWRWCSACEVLYFAGGESLGICPAGGSHTDEGSGDYILHQQPTGLSSQAGWRWCNKCQGLFF